MKNGSLENESRCCNTYEQGCVINIKRLLIKGDDSFEVIY